MRRISLLEQQCCAFLSFHVAAMEGTVRLTITAPESARSVADDLFGPFLPPESSAPLAVSAGSQRSGSLARATATGAACAACCAAPVLWPRIVALAGAGGVGAWAGGALGVGAVAAAIMVAGRFAVGRWRGLSTLGSER